jgi:hypothetical protein
LLAWGAQREDEARNGMDELKGKLGEGCGEGASPGWCECDTASADVRHKLGETGNTIDCARNLASEGM